MYNGDEKGRWKDIRVDLKRTVCNAASTALSVSDIRLGGWQRVTLALPQSSLLLLFTFNRKIFFRPSFARPAVSLAARTAAVSLGSPTICRRSANRWLFSAEFFDDGETAADGVTGSGEMATWMR